MQNDVSIEINGRNATRRVNRVNKNRLSHTRLRVTRRVLCTFMLALFFSAAKDFWTFLALLFSLSFRLIRLTLQSKIYSDPSVEESVNSCLSLERERESRHWIQLLQLRCKHLVASWLPRYAIPKVDIKRNDSLRDLVNLEYQLQHGAEFWLCEVSSAEISLGT